MQVFRLFGVVASAFSVIVLTQYGFDLGSVAAPLQVMLDWYEAFVHLALGWAQPFLQTAVMRLLAWTHWDIQLYPYWRHIFILMGIYLIKGDTLHMTTRGLEPRVLFGSLSGAWWVTKSALRLLPAILIALLASVLAGTIPLSQGDFVANFSVCAVVIAGAALNDFVYYFGVPVDTDNRYKDAGDKDMYLPLIGARTNWQGWGAELSRVLVRALRQLIVGFVVVAVALQIPWIQQLPSPALAILALLVIGRAVFWAIQHFGYYFRSGMPKGEFGLRNTIHGALAVDTLGIFLGVALFVAANAGLKLLGL